MSNRAPVFPDFWEYKPPIWDTGLWSDYASTIRWPQRLEIIINEYWAYLQKRENNHGLFITSVVLCVLPTKEVVQMVRKKQVNNKNGVALFRDFPRWSRSLFITEVHNEHH